MTSSSYNPARPDNARGKLRLFCRKLERRVSCQPLKFEFLVSFSRCLTIASRKHPMAIKTAVTIPHGEPPFLNKCKKAAKELSRKRNPQNQRVQGENSWSVPCLPFPLSSITARRNEKNPIAKVIPPNQSSTVKCSGEPMIAKSHATPTSAKIPPRRQRTAPRRISKLREAWS